MNKNEFIFFYYHLQTQESPIHYASKSGNINILKEIISQLQPIDAQVACNKQAKVFSSDKLIKIFKINNQKLII